MARRALRNFVRPSSGGWKGGLKAMESFTIHYEDAPLFRGGGFTILEPRDP